MRWQQQLLHPSEGMDAAAGAEKTCRKALATSEAPATWDPLAPCAMVRRLPGAIALRRHLRRLACGLRYPQQKRPERCASGFTPRERRVAPGIRLGVGSGRCSGKLRMPLVVAVYSRSLFRAHFRINRRLFIQKCARNKPIRNKLISLFKKIRCEVPCLTCSE